MTSGSIDYIGPYWDAFDGKRSIDLDGNFPGAIQQTFDTDAGIWYQVLFNMAGNPDTLDSSKVFIPKLLGVTGGSNSQEYSFDASNQTRDDMGWIEQTFIFQAIGGDATTLEFASLMDPSSPYGVALDNVRVSETTAPVPEPATMLLLGTGLVGLAGFRKKRFLKQTHSI